MMLFQFNLGFLVRLLKDFLHIPLLTSFMVTLIKINFMFSIHPIHPKKQKILSICRVLQSITPLSNYNPSWRYYEVQHESFNIMNSFNYYTLLNETFVNGGAEPIWRFEYSARDLYDPDGTWPGDAPLNATFWHKYVLTQIKNETNIEFNQKFSEMQYRFGPGVLDCKTALLFLMNATMTTTVLLVIFQ